MQTPLDIIHMLATPGERLPAVVDWLTTNVWSAERFSAMAPEEFLREGERMVNEVEQAILVSAPRLYDELVAASMSHRSLLRHLVSEEPGAIVVLDGASIREIPLLLSLATSSGFQVETSTYGFAALPSETVHFIEQRILGKAVAPSELPRRHELKEQDIAAIYYDSPTRHYPISPDAKRLLLWSIFPDVTYKDAGAKFASHFGEMRNLYETVWKNLVMEIPRNHRVVITSDHGYIFFGQGLDATHINPGRLLDQDRCKFFGPDESLPVDLDEIQIIPEKRLGMLRGRIKNRPQGPAAKSAYRHGGMSLMEMLTPFLIIRRI